MNVNNNFNFVSPFEEYYAQNNDEPIKEKNKRSAPDDFLIQEENEIYNLENDDEYMMIESNSHSEIMTDENRVESYPTRHGYRDIHLDKEMDSWNLVFSSIPPSESSVKEKIETKNSDDLQMIIEEELEENTCPFNLDIPVDVNYKNFDLNTNLF